MAYSTITKPSLYMNTKLYTGNGGTQSISGVGFQPDWLWIKSRGSTGNHRAHDVVRGVDKQLYPNLTNEEYTYSPNTGVTSFDSDGFSLGSDIGQNTNNETYVSWNWKAGGTGSANTDGSINSTVSVNTTAGFSISKFTGTGANATVGHGLGAVPGFYIVKGINKVHDWRIYHKSLGATKSMEINENSAVNTTIGNWNNTEPTSSVFNLGTFTAVNENGKNYIAYCFAEKAGYSKFGKYTGNGSAEGPFVYTGFKPAWVLTKRTDATGNWHIFDNKRPTTNPTDKVLNTNTNAAESDEGQGFDFHSNGFKIRESGNFVNAGSSPFIYVAFAQEPIVANIGTNGIPTTAK